MTSQTGAPPSPRDSAANHSTPGPGNGLNGGGPPRPAELPPQDMTTDPPVGWRARLSAGLRQLLARLAPPRRIRPTRSGLGFMGLSLAIGFAALNTGNNLLYLVLGMMLSLLSISGVLSELSVQRLQVRRVVPPELVAGADMPVQLVIENPRRFTPAYGIWVEERWPASSDGSPAYALMIPAGGSLTLRTHWRFSVRGRYQFSRMEVLTLFPFGFFRRSYFRDVPLSVLVLPPVEPVTLRLQGTPEREGQVAKAKRGRGDDFYGLRQYQSGEDPRLIHWRSSARQGRLVARELAEHQRKRVLVMLELNSSLPEEAVYEAGIVKLASYAAAYLRAGFEVGVDCPGVRVPFEAGETHVRLIRRQLAMAPRADEAADLNRTLRLPQRSGVVIIRVASTVTVEERV